MDLEDNLLMMPGPVPVAPRVLRAMSKPMINHRSTEFAGIILIAGQYFPAFFKQIMTFLYLAVLELRVCKLLLGL